MTELSPWLLIALGGGAGLLGALLGLGGGIFLVPLLTLALGVPIRAAIAASLISVIATASASSTVTLDRGLVNLRLGMVLEVASSFLYFGRGDVAFPLSAAIALGALPGSLLGARLTHRVQARSLKVIMAAVLLIVGAQMALKTL